MLKHEESEFDTEDVVPVAKERRCLMCGSDFRSAHVGERICGRCRQSKVWRDGDTPNYGGHR